MCILDLNVPSCIKRRKNHYALQVSVQAKKLSKSYGKQSAGGNESKNV